MFGQARRGRIGRPFAALAERLESREMLAGDVSVDVFRGDLFLRGDQADNAVEVRSAGDQLVISGLAGTLVEGQSSVSIPAADVNDDLRITLGGGSDSVTIEGVHVPDDVYVSAGTGDDRIQLNSVRADSVALYGAAGEDSVLVNELLARNLAIRGNQGNNVLGIANTNVQRDISLDGGSSAIVGLLQVTIEDDARISMRGESALAIQGSEVNDDTIITGYGPTDVLIQESVHHDDVRITTWSRSDFVAINDVEIGGVARIRLGWGNDALAVNSTTIAGHALLDGGLGTDALQATDVTFVTEDPRIFSFEVEGVENLDARVQASLDALAAAGLVPTDDRPSIAEIVASNEDFETLLTAVELAGLTDTLAGAGNFTVFAPTDVAFQQLGDALDAVLADPNGALFNVLTYHVVGERLPAAELIGRSSVTTLQGQEISLEVTNDGLVLNGNSLVVAQDIPASNGIVHVINMVLLPAETTPSIADLVAARPELSRLNYLLERTGLASELEQGEFTLFAPINSGLSAIPEPITELLLRFAPQLIRELLLDHVAAGRFDAATLLAGQEVTTLGGFTVALSQDATGVRLNTALPTSVVEADIATANGLVHLIDRVIIG